MKYLILLMFLLVGCAEKCPPKEEYKFKFLQKAKIKNGFYKGVIVIVLKNNRYIFREDSKKIYKMDGICSGASYIVKTDKTYSIELHVKQDELIPIKEKKKVVTEPVNE